MFRKILPRQVDFFGFFEEHSIFGIEASQALVGMLQSGADLPACALAIKEIERKADSIIHACTDALHKTFITPIDRSDILGLMQRMDDIVDAVESIATRLVLYEIREARPEAQALADVLVRACREIAGAVTLLRNMKNAEAIKRHCITLFELENEGDTLMRTALADLFRRETDAITIIKWKEILERLERATDRCESVANVIQGIVIEAS